MLNITHATKQPSVRGFRISLQKTYLLMKVLNIGCVCVCITNIVLNFEVLNYLLYDRYHIISIRYYCYDTQSNILKCATYNLIKLTKNQDNEWLRLSVTPLTLKIKVPSLTSADAEI